MGTTQLTLEDKLIRLRELWKTDKANRKIIVLQARAIKRALEIKKTWKDSGSVKDKKRVVEVIEAIF